MGSIWEISTGFQKCFSLHLEWNHWLVFMDRWGRASQRFATLSKEFVPHFSPHQWPFLNSPPFTFRQLASVLDTSAIISLILPCSTLKFIFILKSTILIKCCAIFLLHLLFIGDMKKKCASKTTSKIIPAISAALAKKNYCSSKTRIYAPI